MQGLVFLKYSTGSIYALDRHLKILYNGETIPLYCLNHVPPGKSDTTRYVSEKRAFVIRSQRILLKDRAEFLEGVEGLIAGPATERAQAEDILHLNELLKESRRHLDEGLSHRDAFIQTDNELHRAMAHMETNDAELP